MKQQDKICPFQLPVFAFCLLIFAFAGCMEPPYPASGITFRNPRVFNVHYSFELTPDPEKIDRDRDLKVWMPVPAEWESQKRVRIVNISPAPQGGYRDPEHGNQIFYWDLAQEQVQEPYKIDMEFRLESFEVHGDIDPGKVGPYDTSDEEYQFYTRSSNTIDVSPRIEGLAKEAIGTETNPYLQAKRMYAFVKERMRFGFHEYQRGRGTESFLDHTVTDPESGLEYFEGWENQHAIFFVALCRAAGIPARTVQGIFGYDTSVREEDLKPTHEMMISPAGLGGARHWGSDRWQGRPVLRPITWAEFLIPDHGWIPVDFSHDFGHTGSRRMILSKGRDILIGPEAPEEARSGYGTQWMLLQKGRTDLLLEPIWNIGRIQRADIKAFHIPDPFPADAIAAYLDYKRASADGKEMFPKSRRSRRLRMLYNFARSHKDAGPTLQDAHLCHLFRQIVGVETFDEIVQTYLSLRLSSPDPIPVSTFKETAENIYGDSLGWFFDQWFEMETYPQIKLKIQEIEKKMGGWSISGEINQTGETIIRTPIEVGIYTDKEMETRKVLPTSKSTRFEFQTRRKPRKMILDPDYHIPCIRKMPPQLSMIWQHYPDLILVFGTVQEGDANRDAAERFNHEILGLDLKVVMADTSAFEEDLRGGTVLLFGRPDTGTAIGRLQSAFPIQFEDDHFFWEDITYDSPSHGVMQIIENPVNADGWIVQYAGLSGKTTLQTRAVTTDRPELSGESFTWHEGPFSACDASASYIIYEDRSVLVSGDWEQTGNMVWDF